MNNFLFSIVYKIVKNIGHAEMLFNAQKVYHKKAKKLIALMG